MNSLTLAQAQRIVEGALATGRQMGLAPLAVAVLDAGGHLSAFAREDDAGILRPQIAVGKAWGALGMGAGTRSLAAKSPEFLAALGAMSGGKVVPAPGGVLIRDDASKVVGAVGISGDTGVNDEACAVAGIEQVGLIADTG
jgi:uncharacterized protein GlcG (DUF336 family)